MQHTKKKILYVITKSNWGGAQKYVYDLATALPKELFEVIVAFGGSGPLAEKLKSSDIRTLSIPSLGRDINILDDIKSLCELYRILKKEKPDIVHVNSSKVGGLGACAARMTGIRRIIFTCHGWPFNEDRSFLSLASITLLSWLTVVLSHLTITVSNRDLSDGKKLFGIGRKLRLVHNGVRTPLFKTPDMARTDIIKRAHNLGVHIDTKDVLIGAMGELHKNKGYEYLIEAFAELLLDTDIPTKLVIMGEGEKRKEIEELIAKFNLKNHVALLGFVENSPTYLKAFDIFTLTSIKEGLPYVIIEAGFAGLPTVATNVGGVKEIIDDMKSGILVQTRKPTDIAQGLLMLTRQRDKATIFGTTLQEKVTKEFSLEKMVEETIKLYS